MNTNHNGFRILAVAVIVPALITIASLIAMFVLASSGPSRIVTHWGYAGQADRYGSPFTYLVLMGAVAVPLIVVLGGGAVLLAHRAALSPVIKLAAVAGVWMSSFLAIVFTGSLLAQRTASDVAATGSPGLEILVGVAVALVLGVGAWFVLPPAVRRSASADQAATPAISLATNERASWLRSATASRGLLAVFIGLILVLGASQFLVVWVSDGRAWWVSFVPIVVLLIVLASFAWTVRIDSRGVRIRSALGIPSIGIPIDNVASATVVNVSPISEFGGYGFRWSLNGRFGIILRSGEALEIRRHNGLDVVITVDDATTAAALLNGLVARGSEVAPRT
jgi:hypothetical protein